MDLIKIGGAVLRNKDGFFKMVDILNNYSARPLVIVISAFSTATRDLADAARFAEQGNETEAKKILDNVINEHISYAAQLLHDRETLESLDMLFQSSKERLSEFLKGLSITGELTPRTLDAILSFGEFFALHTVNHFLQEQGFKVNCIDSTSIIVSDENYGNAKPLIKETSKLVKNRILPLLKNDAIVLTQGFVAKDLSGEITTMGIESSNLTAVLLAEILDIDKITFWSDVQGIRSADPKEVAVTKPVKNLSYDEAYKAAVNGLKLIHPGMSARAAEKKIKLIYRSAFEPNGDLTIISGDSQLNHFNMIIAANNQVYAEINLRLSDINYHYNNKPADLFQNPNITFYSNYPDSLKLIFHEDRNFEKKIKQNFGVISIQNSTLISILTSDDIKQHDKIHKIIIDFKADIISFEFSEDVIRLIVKPGSTQKVIDEIHKKIIVF